MTNQELVDKAFSTNNTEMKNIINREFQYWCNRNNRSTMNINTKPEWLKLEVENIEAFKKFLD